MGQKLTPGQKLHGALRTPRKRLSESVCQLYAASYIQEFGPRKSGPTFELLTMRAVHMITSGNRTFITPQALLHWVSSDDGLSSRSEDRVWESLALAFSALAMPAARLNGERKGRYAVSLSLPTVPSTEAAAACTCRVHHHRAVR